MEKTKDKYPDITDLVLRNPNAIKNAKKKEYLKRHGYKKRNPNYRKPPGRR